MKYFIWQVNMDSDALQILPIANLEADCNVAESISI